MSAKNLGVSIGDKEILFDLNFEIPRGILTGILGPNGSGKTTLLRSVSGLIPYDGVLLLEGKPISEWKSRDRARRISVVQQVPSIHFDFTVLDYILLGRMPHKRWLERSTPEDKELVHELLTELNLYALKDRTLPTLSGGERQRVLLAQALAQKPSLLLLDEPTTHLDIYYKLDLLKHIRAIVDRGTSVLAVFHDLTLAAQFSELLLILDRGKQIAFGDTEKTLTPEMIQNVFRIDSEIFRDDQQRPHIHYRNIIT